MKKNKDSTAFIRDKNGTNLKYLRFIPMKNDQLYG